MRTGEYFRLTLDADVSDLRFTLAYMTEAIPNDINKLLSRLTVRGLVPIRVEEHMSTDMIFAKDAYLKGAVDMQAPFTRVLCSCRKHLAAELSFKELLMYAENATRIMPRLADIRLLLGTATSEDLAFIPANMTRESCLLRAKLDHDLEPLEPLAHLFVHATNTYGTQ